MGHKEIAEALNTPRKATYNICYEEDCRNGHRPVTLAKICDISARGVVARLEAGYTTFYTYAELIRDDGVRI